MTNSDVQFQDLMTRMLAGSEDAAEELFRLYEPHLVHAIRRKLHKKIRSKFDSLDFAQDVWASFFAEPHHQRPFENSEELVAHLIALARNKVVEKIRQRMIVPKYNVNREQSLDDSRRFDKESLISPDPSPSFLLSNEDEWKAFLRKQPLVYQRIFILLREGKTNLQIAQELGIHTRTVLRAAKRLSPGVDA